MTYLRSGLSWISKDYLAHPARFCVEILAWVLSISCSVIMALTVPAPPLLMLYPMWIAGCSMYAWAAWSRQSFGMLANYVLLTSIDIFGLIRMVING